MSATDITHPRDGFGLPKLDIGPGGDENQRDHSRAPLMSGGTVTGNSFQTSPTDPRIVIDSNALVAHRADGATTINIDVNAGTVAFLADSNTGGGIRFLDTTGAVKGRIIDDSSYGFGGLTIDTTDAVQLLSMATLGTPSSTPRAVLYANQNNAGSGIPFAELAVVAATRSGGFSADASGGQITLGLFTNDPASEAFEVVKGNALLSINATEKHLLCALATFTCTFGMRFVAAAAANIFSVFDQYRMMRGNTAGTVVTPGAFTQTTIVTNTNVTSTSVSVVRSEGAMFNISPTAAGVCIAVEVWTAS